MPVAIPIEEINLDLEIDLDKEIPCEDRDCADHPNPAEWLCNHNGQCHILICTPHRDGLIQFMDLARKGSGTLHCVRCNTHLNVDDIRVVRI